MTAAEAAAIPAETATMIPAAEALAAIPAVEALTAETTCRRHRRRRITT
ncbi:MAG: hypothetical protein ACLUN5_06410 [Oscillospiraceae bacterium]